ncbi:MAG: YdeI/OmpD-associated family protein [Pseudomonadota bacterium]
MANETEFQMLEIETAADLWDWLEVNHAQAESVWLVTYKKSTPEKFVGTGDVLDALIAFGWIDGVRRKLDELRTMQLIAPRKTQAWALSYKERAARLDRGGRMHPAGRDAIARSKAAGLWDFFDDVDRLIVPEDLATALDANGARGPFDEFAPSYRRNVLRWIKIAKTQKTREKRIVAAAEATAAGRKLSQM